MSDLPVNKINSVKEEYPIKNNIQGSNKKPDNMYILIQTFFPNIEIKKEFKLGSRFTADYFLESKRLAIEFDGPHHYQLPFKIETDMRKNIHYQEQKIFRIKWPYFYTLTKDIAKFVFGDLCMHYIKENFYSEEKYSSAINKIYWDSKSNKPATLSKHVLSPGFHATKDTPGSFCDQGIKRFFKELNWKCIDKNCNCKAISPTSLKHQIKYSLDLYLEDILEFNGDKRRWLVVPENNDKFNEFMKIVPNSKYLDYHFKRRIN
jgi:hypothetical protein